jgi:hypothetical protein
MRIEIMKHGDPKLWPLIGPFLCNRSVHQELGGPIYSTEAVTWYVAIDGGLVVGWATLRATPAAIWYDYGYVLFDQRCKGVFSQLATARDKDAAKLGVPLRIVVREDRWKNYQQRKWKVTSRRGSWVHGTKEKL